MLQFDPLHDSKSALTLLSTFDQDLDLQIVNDAKASYERESGSIGDKEIKLINRLVGMPNEPQHTSPLRGVVFRFKVKCPLFVARQWYKHHVASSYVDCQDGWNETSYRYIEASEDFYIPATFYKQDLRNKQASGEPLDDDMQQEVLRRYEVAVENAYQSYKLLMAMGVVREQARALLPPCMYTTFHWTVSLHALYNFIDLRSGHGAQTEIVAYANCLKDVCVKYVPYTSEAWLTRKWYIQQALENYDG